MLRKVLLGLGALCLLGVITVLITGHGRVVLPHLVAGVVVFGLAVMFEDWRYKRIHPSRLEAHWQDTGERFIDPETQQLTAVYFDPRTGERHYVAQPDSRRKT